MEARQDELGSLITVFSRPDGHSHIGPTAPSQPWPGFASPQNVPLITKRAAHPGKHFESQGVGGRAFGFWCVY